MPVNSIISQPASNSLNAAYRPVVLKVNVANITLGTSATDSFTAHFYLFQNQIQVDYTGHTSDFMQAFFTAGYTITVSGAGSPGNNATFTIQSISYATGNLHLYVREPVSLELTASVTITKNVKIVTPSVVFCDVYVAGTYYKTVSKTKFLTDNGANSDWQFDIQDPAQEQLGKFIGANGGTAVVRADQLMKSVSCKFRSSTLDSEGFIAPEDTPPGQASGLYPAVAGTGTASNTFFIINSVLQHLSNQDIASHLTAFKTNSASTWAANAYPLTHRPATYFIGHHNSDYYPFVYTGSATFTTLRLYYRYRGTIGFSSQDVTISVSASAGVYYIPNGTKNLRSLFSINFRSVDVYYIQLYDNTGASVMTTCYNKVDINIDEVVRLHFLTYTGAFDAITFIKPSVLHESTDATYQNGSKYPLSKTDFGIARSNVRSNDTTTAITKNYLDDSMSWIQELFDSPVVFAEWKGTEGQADSYIPVTIINGKLDKLKNNGEWEYVTTVQYKNSNEFMTIRN